MSAVDHPKHYNAHPSGVEAIEICELLNFNLGNAVKYLFRAGHKGERVTDIEKAVWYLRREAERRAHDADVYLGPAATSPFTASRLLALIWRVLGAEPANDTPLADALSALGNGDLSPEALRALAGRIEAYPMAF